MAQILIMGLPGAGKTTLANALAPRLNAVNLNADAVRENVNRDLGFSLEDRIEQARRMGWLCDKVLMTGGFVIADFIQPPTQFPMSLPITSSSGLSHEGDHGRDAIQVGKTRGSEGGTRPFPSKKQQKQ